MALFSGARRVLGLVKATQSRGIITVDGVPADVLVRAFDQIAQTTRVSKNIFLSRSTNSFSFLCFFAVEVEYLLLEAAQKLDSWSTTRTITKIIDAINENTWMRSTIQPVQPMVDLRLLKTLKWTALPHQLEFLKTYGVAVPKYGLRGLILAARPGSGKTFMDVALAATVIPRSIAQVKIIISPKNAVGLVWEKTIKEVFRKAPTCWTSDQAGEAPVGNEYYVFHYEALDRALALAQKLIAKGVRYFVAVDESHNFNIMTSQRTQNLVKLCTMPKWPVYQVWASGTPVKAMGVEIIPALTALDPWFNQHAALAFKKAFSNDKQGAMQIVAHRFGIISYKAMSPSIVQTKKPIEVDLKVKLEDPEPYLISTIKADMKQFFEERLAFYQENMAGYRKIFEDCVRVHRGTLTTLAQRKKFNQWIAAVNIVRDASRRGLRPDPIMMSAAKSYEDTVLIPSLPAEWQKQFKQVRTVVKTVRMKVQGEALGRIGRRRAMCSNEMAENADIINIVNEAEAKTIIFSSYVSPVEKAAQRLEAAGLIPVRIFGDEASNVTKLVNDFTNNPDLNPICATIMSLSTAVPVIAANTEIFLDLPFRHFLYEQAVARVDRLGQTKQTHIFRCVLDTGNDPNISMRGLDILDWSKEQSDLLMSDDMDVDLTTFEFPT